MKYTLGIDISTEKMGWCLLEETAPSIYGQFKLKDLEYQGTAGRLLVNAMNQIEMNFSGRLYKHLNGRKTDADTFRVIIECGAIANGRAVGTVRKLAMYSGMIANVVREILDSAGFIKFELKIVAPDEWQRIAYDGIYSEIVEYRGRVSNKAKSLVRASEMLKDITSDLDDLADAYNMATVYDQVLDINDSKQRANLEKRKGLWIATLKMRKSKLRIKLNDYENRSKIELKNKRLPAMIERVKKSIEILDYQIAQKQGN